MQPLISEYLRFKAIYDINASVEKRVLFRNHSLRIIIQNDRISVYLDDNLISNVHITECDDQYTAEITLAVYNLVEGE